MLPPAGLSLAIVTSLFFSIPPDWRVNVWKMGPGPLASEKMGEDI
jgi:hypothetical protein